MDEATRRELTKLRADVIAMCDKSRELAEHVVSIIDAEITGDQREGHRKPRHSHLRLVKAIITGAAAYAVIRRLAAVAAASAVTAAAVTVVTAPLVLRSPAPSPSSPRRPAVAQSAAPHRGRRRPVVAVKPGSVPATMATVGTGVVPAASPSPSPTASPLISVSVSPSPSAPSCLIRLLGLCIP